MQRLVSGILAGCAGAVLTALAFFTFQTAEAERVTCRPSHPALAMATDPRPVVLFWGNSLLFDHGWDHPGFAAVNCARQGLTVTAALSLVQGLPDLEPEAVVLAFGSVELIRPGPIDLDRWQADITAMRMALRARYPKARVILSTIPTGPSDWRYGAREELAQMNTALRQLPETETFELAEVFAAAEIALPHYDGVHLNLPSYRAWTAALAAQIAQAP